MPLEFHRREKGKIQVTGTVPLDSEEDMNRAYTPGVAEPVEEIDADRDKVYEYTAKGRTVGIVSDGSAVLGLGDVGPEAAIPVMEGKALLINELADTSAFPVMVDTNDPDEIVETVARLHAMYGFIMLEDIASPACFAVEEALKERLDVPVFHDDQHGAAIAVLAALKNACTVTDRDLADTEIVVVGAGAAGIATTELLLAAGAEHVRLVDLPGILAPGMDLSDRQAQIAARTNPDGETGSLEDALVDADVLIGLSAGGIVSKEMVASMAADPIVFALANPEPEIMPDAARDVGARVIGTGRSDFPNQINNALAFPGIVKGTLACNAFDINTEMKLAAADALADLVDDPRPEHVIPDPLDARVADAVAAAVTSIGAETGACRVTE